MNNQRGISGSALKIIAVITMFIDHFAAGLVYPGLVNGSVRAWCDSLGFHPEWETLTSIYYCMRHIGRIAFPIFCFLLVEGFYHSTNRMKYLSRLLLFSIISEPFFDMCLVTNSTTAFSSPLAWYEGNAPHIWNQQNVYLTLALGLIAIWLMNMVREEFSERPIIGLLLSLVPLSIMAAMAYYASTDYDFNGVILIAIFYLFHSNRIVAAGYGYLYLLLTMSGFSGGLSQPEFLPLTVLHKFVMAGGTEQWSLPAFILIIFYNGQRGFIGRSSFSKWFFYAFYPLHLLLIFILRNVLMP